MTAVPAFAAPTAGVPLQRTTIERRPVGENDVLIEIKYVGICHTDIHHVRDDWGRGGFPLVPGHEIAGVVAEVGPGVTGYQVGDRVGVGCMVDSCRKCENCRNGQEVYCTGGGLVATYADTMRYTDGAPTQGGYSTQIVVDERFVLGIPEGLSLEQAAPLLCAGITTYSPLRHWNAGPGRKVAVIGLGGLGHLGVKFAHALGAEVTVLSQSLRKKDDGLRLGADHYYATSDPKTFEELAGAFDLILNTVSASLDGDAYLSLLRTDGTMVYLGVPEKPLSVNMPSLMMGRKSIASSGIGGIPETQEMLDFAAANGIRADVEVISADEIEQAYDRVLRSDVRYRFVIDNSTI
ncbi:NAD(P)-dependent alcohol dehydrogenase [Streptomyces sp. NPDC048410]|uniref:NAD(P)-dependent alcohol dehydrogenase n=1 Tax=Streptomyces sp. NPDC048410 TaxID=3365545 RepID=UPI00371ADACD